MERAITAFFLSRYEDGDYVLQQKARLLLVFASFIFLFALIFGGAVILRDVRDPLVLGPIVIGGGVSLPVLALLKRGRYAPAAHLLVIGVITACWLAFFFGDMIDPVEKTDSMVLVLAALSLAPLVIREDRRGIILYFAFNYLLFLIFAWDLHVRHGLPVAVVVEYFIDYSIGFGFLGLTMYEVFRVHQETLCRAAEKGRELLASREQYQRIFDNIKDVYFETTLDGTVVEISPSIEEVSLYRREDIVGHNQLDLGVDAEQRMQLLHILLSEGGIAEKEVVFPEKDGHPRYCSLSARLVRDDQGTPVRVVGSLRDISARKQAEQEGELLRERLARAEKMEALGLLAGGVAHDLNNILSGIVTYPELLLLDLPPESRLRKPVLAMRESGRRAAEIVHDLLTLARRGVRRDEVLELNEVVRSYLNSAEYAALKARHANIVVHERLAAEPLPVKGSGLQMRKALMNLVTNACEAQSAGGSIVVTTGLRRLREPLRGYMHIDTGDYAVMTVADRGSGIAAEDIQRIFEPFYTKKVMGRSGTGLGMAVVWGTVQDHGGAINVSSREGEGSVFEVYFPLTAEQRAAPPPKVALEDYRGRGEQILVVDDEAQQRDIAAELLVRLGYRVETAAGGAQALEKLVAGNFQLVMMDMIMDPSMDGLDTYRAMRNLGYVPPTVIVSGYAEDDRVREALSLGAGPYLRKPYALEGLGVMLRQSLQRCGAKNEACGGVSSRGR